MEIQVLRKVGCAAVLLGSICTPNGQSKQQKLGWI